MKAAGVLPSAQTILSNMLTDGLQEWNSHTLKKGEGKVSSKAFCDSATQEGSKAEKKNFPICLFRAVSELGPNTSVAWSLGFFFFCHLHCSLCNPPDRPVYDGSTIRGLCRAGDEPSLEIKVTVAKSKIITTFHSKAQH